MAKLELALLVGAESKEWLTRMEALVARLEKAVGKVKAAKDEEPETEEDDAEEEEDFAPKKKSKKSIDLDEEEEETEEDDDEEEDDEEEEAPVKKKPGRKKKLTEDDVNEACKARVARLIEEGNSKAEARADVVGLLKKKFKVASVSELEPETYETVITAMAK